MLNARKSVEVDISTLPACNHGSIIQPSCEELKLCIDKAMTILWANTGRLNVGGNYVVCGPVKWTHEFTKSVILEDYLKKLKISVKLWGNSANNNKFLVFRIDENKKVDSVLFLLL